MSWKPCRNFHTERYNKAHSEIIVTAIKPLTTLQYERCFVKSLGWYENDDAVFIAMEYFKHGDLHHYLYSASPLPESDAQQVTFQVLEGLHFMHENGYSHRDLKPGVSVVALCEAVRTSNVGFIDTEYFSEVKTARPLVG